MLTLANHVYIPLDRCTVKYALKFKINCQNKRKSDMIVQVELIDTNILTFDKISQPLQIF